MSARWIWFEGSSRYGVLRQKLLRPSEASTLRVQCASFDRYELYLDGWLALEGPLPGDDPRWIPIDQKDFTIEPGDKHLLVDILVYHSGLDFIHYRGKTAPGFWATLSMGGETVVTDTSWQAAPLLQWSMQAPRMNHLLDPLEDIDLRQAKWCWRERGTGLHIDQHFLWGSAQELDRQSPLAENVWRRKDGFVTRSDCEARTVHRGFLASESFPQTLEAGISSATLSLERKPLVGSLNKRQVRLSEENLWVVDFGDAITGIPLLELKVDRPLEIYMGWSERLGDDHLPVLYSKGTRYCARYRVPPGLHTLKTFHWTGFRYLVVAIRPLGDGSDQVTLTASAVRRYLKLPSLTRHRPPSTTIGKIEALCRHTLEKTLPEYPADCPTREKAHYWADGLYMGLALEKLYQHRGFLDWYFEAFRRVPTHDSGLFSSVYPGNHRVLVDACFFPVIGWRYASRLNDNFRVDDRLWAKALAVYNWCQQHVSKSGLLEPPGWNIESDELIFLDHSGLPWHRFSGPPLDRRNPSATLNLFYLGFLQSLELGCGDGRIESAEICAHRDRLAGRIAETFWDGRVIRDSDRHAYPQGGISWLANSLAVLTGVLRGEIAVNVMREIIERYDNVCRCTPGTLFWFLQATSLCGLNDETEEVLGRLFQTMLDAGAVATWETFDGNIDDSLCHPWLAAPVAMYLSDTAGFAHRLCDQAELCR